MKVSNIIAGKKNNKKGMTLLELTVVILVLLSLISILFIGARAWKRGSDRAGCIMNIRNAQQAVRAYGNMYEVAPGSVATVDSAKLIGTGLFLEKAPTCPGGGVYTTGTKNPDIGTLWLTCDKSTTDQHVPTEFGSW